MHDLLDESPEAAGGGEEAAAAEEQEDEDEADCEGQEERVTVTVRCQHSQSSDWLRLTFLRGIHCKVMDLN